MKFILTSRQQGLAVAGFGAAVLGAVLLVLAGSDGMSQPESDHARFVPSDEQLRAFAVQPVVLHVFRTEILADGYVAAGAGGKSGANLPVLPNQATDMLQAENDFSAAQVQYRNAAAAQDRQHKLYLSQGAALKDWQQSQADLATAASALATAKNKLRLLGKVDAGKGGAITVGDGSTIWLIANVRESDAGLVHVGDTLTAHLPAWSGHALSGRVSFVSAVIDPTTHRLAVGAQVTNPGGVLKPNMLASVYLLGSQGVAMPAVPRNALIYDGEQVHAWVVESGRHLSQRMVSTGRVSGDGLVEITAGLKAGEHIATAGGLFIDQAVAGD
jgi:cobalt-zinc-cadmium efflux system membrane fusion protein